LTTVNHFVSLNFELRLTFNKKRAKGCGLKPATLLFALRALWSRVTQTTKNYTENTQKENIKKYFLRLDRIYLGKYGM